MGTCFRWKKKNSYTVTQIDEYTPSGGKYNVNKENAARVRPSRQPANNAASHWATESRGDVTKRQEVEVKQNDMVVTTKNDDFSHNDVTNEPKINDVIRENGFHSEQLKSPTPDPSPPSSPEEERSPIRTEPEVFRNDIDASEHQFQEDSDHESLELATKAVTVEEVHVSSQRFDADFTADVSNDSSVSAPEVVMPVRSSFGSDDSDNDREDPILARDEYLAQKALDEGYDNTHTTTIITETVSQEVRAQPDGSFDETPDILHSQEDIHITDSPAGTWDARLNKDVRAELDEVQNSLDGSKTNSTVSLETRDMHVEDDVVVKPARDPMVIQRVKFDVPDTDEDDDGDETEAGLSVISVTNDTHVVDQSDNPFQITTYETYHTEHVIRDAEMFDNDVNDRLAVIGENEYEFPGEPALHNDDEGEIVLSDEYAVSYEEPSSPRRLSGGYTATESY